ncbi:unnamed protein product, partial [marine sediment metagenome]
MSSKCKRRLTLESMEPRCMMAGAVTAWIDLAGDLQVHGDAASNQVLIQSAAAGTYQVTGLYGTTGSYTLSPSGGDVHIHMGDGNDQVFIDNVNTGDNLNIQTGKDHDVVDIRRSNLTGTTKVDTGPGDAAPDTVDIQNSNLMNLAIRTFAEN